MEDSHFTPTYLKQTAEQFWSVKVSFSEINKSRQAQYLTELRMSFLEFLLGNTPENHNWKLVTQLTQSLQKFEGGDAAHL